MAGISDWLLGGMFSQQRQQQMAERERQWRAKQTLNKIMSAPIPGTVFNPDARGLNEMPIVHGAKQLAKSIFGAPEAVLNLPFEAAGAANQWARNETAALSDMAFTTDAQRAARATAAPPAAAPSPTAVVGAPAAGPRGNPFSAAAVSGMADWAKQMGATVTSIGRTAERNKQVGGTANSFHLSSRAFDSTPPKGMNMGQWAQTLRSQFPGWDVINEGDHVHVEPPSVGGQVKDVLGDPADIAGMFVNPAGAAAPFNQAAMGQINAAEKAMLTPFSASINKGPMPELPAPEAIPTTDFTASDQALEALKPVEMVEKDKLRMERDGWFKGLASAMMNMSGNEPIGTFLMKVGGATLAGREKARDEIRERQDKFETKMAQYNAAVYQNEMGKAQTIAREAQAQVQQNNQFAVDQYKVAMQQWQNNNTLDVSGVHAIIKTLDPKTGKQTVQGIPIPAMVNAEFSRLRATEYARQGQQQIAGASMVASNTNSLIAGTAAPIIAQAVNGGTTPETAVAVAAAPVTYASHIVKYGKAPELLGEEQYNSLLTDVRGRLKLMQLVPGSEAYVNKLEELMADDLARIGMRDPDFLTNMANLASTQSAYEAAQVRRTVRTTTNARGQRSTGVTEVFAGQE